MAVAAVFKVEKQKNYTVMSNYHLQDKNLSFKAKGLLSFMLSLPEDWDYSLKGLVAVSKENIKAIRTILNELKEHGYLEINQTRAEHGYYKYEYVIREIPIDIEKQQDNNEKDDNSTDDQKGCTVEGETEKEHQIITKTKNKKEKTVKDVKVNLPFLNLDELNPLTLDLINSHFIEPEDTQIYYYDNLFEELLKKGYKYKDIITMTHYITSRIISRGFKDEEDNEIKNKYGFFKGAIYNCISKLEINERIEIDPETGWFKDADEEQDYDIDIY